MRLLDPPRQVPAREPFHAIDVPHVGIVVVRRLRPVAAASVLGQWVAADGALVRADRRIAELAAGIAAMSKEADALAALGPETPGIIERADEWIGRLEAALAEANAERLRRAQIYEASRGGLIGMCWADPLRLLEAWEAPPPLTTQAALEAQPARLVYAELSDAGWPDESIEALAQGCVKLMTQRTHPSSLQAEEADGFFDLAPAGPSGRIGFRSTSTCAAPPTSPPVE